ncbi:MAG: hypothetical protein HQM09_11315 [Candidatus Riflebacteria bacterium]|nr:hypothetical protein [Candidatus Riflebacteria bacterium]
MIREKLRAETVEMERLFAGLVRLLEVEGEYVSHLTALYFLGQWPHLPDVLTVVSPRRRRPRTLEGRPLVFILLPPERLKPVQKISMSSGTLTVSTLEKTLIDMAAYLDYAPPIDDFAGLFVSSFFSPSLLLQTAIHSTDSVLKRISWFLGFTGLTASPEIPWESMTRTPIKLDPRVNSEDTLWDARFYLRFPKKLLSLCLPEPVRGLPDEICEWIELRQYRGFIDETIRAGSVILREESSAVAKSRMEDFFRQMLEDVVNTALESFLLAHVDELIYNRRKESRVHPTKLIGVSSSSPATHRKAGHGTPGNGVPLIFNRWFEQHPEAFERIRPAITAWVRRHLRSSNPEKLETAFYFGHRLGLTDEVLESIGSRGTALMNSGRERVIASIVTWHLARGVPLPHSVYIVAARSAGRRGCLDEALEIVETGRKVGEVRGITATETGELAYAAGNALRMLHRFDRALPELFLSRECFEVAKDIRGLVAVNTAMGNLYFDRGMSRQARTWYMRALSCAREVRDMDAQASLLGHLAMIESDSCHLRRAILLFSRALMLQKAGRNRWSTGIILIARGKAYLQTGYITKASRDFQEALAIKTELRHQAGIDECMAMLAWISELNGRSAAAKSWWSAIHESNQGKEPRVIFLVKTIRSMATLFRGNFEEAVTQYRETLDFARANDISSNDEGVSLHGIGMCLAWLGKPGAIESLLEAKSLIGPDSGRLQMRLVNIFGFLHFPEAFADVSIQSELEAVIEAQAFDPFWGWYACSLRELNNPAADTFLSYHMQRTPPTMLQLLQELIPAIGSVIAGFEKRLERAAEFFTHVIDGETRPMHVDDYRIWAHNRHPGTLVFDAPGGHVTYEARSMKVKHGSLAHGILTSLVSAYPRPVQADALFRSVWGTPFDPECDPAALKSAIGRLRRQLRSIHPGIWLRRKISGQETHNIPGSIRLVFPCRWEAVLS